MQWDHPPGVEKLAHVAELYRGRRDRVLTEIAKCELVCANCHAVRTHERRRQAASDDVAACCATYPDQWPP
jgi:predicted HNH restriction endonuclease